MDFTANDVDTMDLPLIPESSQSVVSPTIPQMTSIEVNQLMSKFKPALMLYPAYFDKRKSIDEGRRVPLNIAVNTDVSKGGIPLAVAHIAAALSKLNINEFLVEEHKRYSKDFFGYGRVRVLLNFKDGGIQTPQGLMKNKKMLIRTLAGIIPSTQKEHLDAIVSHNPGYKLSPDTFPFCRDRTLSMTIAFGYGALPDFSTTKVSSKKEEKKNKKKRK
jgi:signal recognition particle subunit SEC65